MRSACRVDPDALLPLEDRHADRLVDSAVAAGFSVLLCDVPRAWVDLNRAPDDLDWPRLSDEPAGRVSARAAAGIGVVPDRLGDLHRLWRVPLSRADVAGRVAAVHEPWHAALRELIDRTRERFGAVVLLDVHSMPATSGRRADVVLGTLRGRSVAAQWAQRARSVLMARGRRVAVDHPYAGAHIAERHGAPAAGRHVLQLEVCRSLYLDAAGREPSAGLERVAADVLAVARAIAGDLARAEEQPLAAE